MNLRNWIIEYYTVYRALELKPTTIRSYLSFINNVPEDWDIENIRLYDVQKLINELASRLSCSSVKHTYQIIREALDNANLIGASVKYRELERVKLPKMRKKIIRALSDADLDKLYPEILKSDYADIYLSLLGTGLRFCELAGLNNESFNPANMTLRIEQRYYRGFLEAGSKTDSGIREIPVSSSLKNILMRHCIIFRPKLPLFRSKNDDRLSYNTILHDWHRICSRANFEPCGLHVLRHTFATRLLDAEVSLKVVSAFLGHKSISVTADIYCDVSMAAKRSALMSLETSEERKNRSSFNA